jgi:predicted transcriptional regulator
MKAGDKVSAYASFTLRLPPDTKALLDDVGTAQNRAIWRILHDALKVYVKTMSSTDRQRVQTLQKWRTADKKRSKG